MNDTLQVSKTTTFKASLTPTKLSIAQSILDSANGVLETIDFPTTRHEDWKYTRVAKIASITQTNKNVSFVDTKNLSILENCITFIFQNGEIRVDLIEKELPKGLTIQALSTCTEAQLKNIGSIVPLENQLFNSINTAYANDGVFIDIAENCILEQKIQIVHILSGTNQIANYRNFIQAGKFSNAHIVQSFLTENSENSFVNSVTEIFVDVNACLHIDKIQNEDEGNFAVITEQVSQEKDSFFQINTLTLNGSLVRNNLNISVNGVNCTTNLNGAYLLKGNQHVDNHTIVDHRAPHCLSNELYKGVMDEKSTGVFNGKVFVRKDSQKINAFQSNGNVLLSDTASINSKPELEIYADDVKCSHGSTTGQLDDEAIFYLRSRGLSEKSARNLMVSAFVEDVLQKISDGDVKTLVHSLIHKRFGWEFSDTQH